MDKESGRSTGQRALQHIRTWNVSRRDIFEIVLVAGMLIGAVLMLLTCYSTTTSPLGVEQHTVEVVTLTTESNQAAGIGSINLTACSTSTAGI